MTTRPTLATDTVLRMALTCLLIAPDHGMTPEQHAWLTTRLKDHTPLTPEERARLREPLLAWCLRRSGERLAAVIARQHDEEANADRTLRGEADGLCADESGD